MFGTYGARGARAHSRAAHVLRRRERDAVARRTSDARVRSKCAFKDVRERSELAREAICCAEIALCPMKNCLMKANRMRIRLRNAILFELDMRFGKRMRLSSANRRRFINATRIECK